MKTNWPDEVRLHMIERSRFYSDNEHIYHYGFYDGYQYLYNKNKNITAGLRELLSEIHIIIQEEKPIYGDYMRYIWNKLSDEITKIEEK